VHAAVPCSGAAGHALPHALQCDVLDVTSVSQPFVPVAASPSQLPYPVAQVVEAGSGTQVESLTTYPDSQVKPQLPAVQVAVPFAGAGHVLPQAPQCVALVSVLVSQPLLVLESQSAYPGSQTGGTTTGSHDVPFETYPESQLMPHVPLRHVAVPFVGVAQVFPQAPQLLTLVSMFVSHPLLALSSQFA
jgi:hypothetical protein